jgi:hypothetical protein
MSDEDVSEDVDNEVADVEVSEGSEVEVSGGEAEAPPEVWQHFRNMEQFAGQDDNAIAQRLYEAMQREEHAARALQQYQSIVPVAQEYLNNRQQYEAWKAAQAAPRQQAPAPAAAPEKGWWNPPEVKDSYKRYLTRDENGREIISPDAPMDARAALEDYMTYRAEFAQKFLDNPEQALGPMVEKFATQRAEAIVGERLGRMQDESFVQSLEEQNKDWLYDESGNVSAEGLAVQKYINDAKSAGINGPKARWEYATKMVERDLLLTTLRQMQQPQQQQQAPQIQQPAAQPQPTRDQRNMEYLRQQAMRTANQRSANNTNAGTPQKPMTFEERLMAVAQEEGILNS